MWLRTLNLVVVFYVLLVYYNCVSHNIFRRLSLLIVHLQYCLVSLISLLLYKQVQISYFIATSVAKPLSISDTTFWRQGKL